MRNTGEFIPAGLSSRDIHIVPTNTARVRDQRPLLTSEARELPFDLEFSSGDKLRITLVGSGAEPSSFWSVIATLKRLTRLTPNWDSYGAEPLRAIAVRRGLELLIPFLRDDIPEPTVVPTREGGLQFEWHRQGVDVEVVIPPAGPPSYFIADAMSGTETEDEGIDRAAISAAFERMSAIH